jgi:hypothetical protein
MVYWYEMCLTRQEDITKLVLLLPNGWNLLVSQIYWIFNLINCIPIKNQNYINSHNRQKSSKYCVLQLEITNNALAVILMKVWKIYILKRTINSNYKKAFKLGIRAICESVLCMQQSLQHKNGFCELGFLNVNVLLNKKFLNHGVWWPVGKTTLKEARYISSNHKSDIKRN